MYVAPICSYLNAIQTCCPHIFRYITAAVITNKKRQVLLKDLVKVIKHVSLPPSLPPSLLWLTVVFLQESYSYRDPITEFVECLYVNFDFDLAQQKLIECEKVGTHRVLGYLSWLLVLFCTATGVVPY